jgi:hypothetical protein
VVDHPAPLYVAVTVTPRPASTAGLTGDRLAVFGDRLAVFGDRHPPFSVIGLLRFR